MTTTLNLTRLGFSLSAARREREGESGGGGGGRRSAAEELNGFLAV